MYKIKFKNVINLFIIFLQLFYRNNLEKKMKINKNFLD